MTRYTFSNSGLLAATLCFATVSAGQDITSMERQRALTYLISSRSGVEQAITGLSEAQWNFKPAPERWSIAEVLEHITVTEELVTTGVRMRLEKGPAPQADRDTKKIDTIVLDKVVDRSTKIQAPPQLAPTLRWTPSVTVEHFLAGRERTIEWLNADTNLRGHLADHPVLGPLDGYEWILAIAGHSDRHTKQILEVKADPNFPK